ncbi:MAG: tetratricopeptide repeat protein [Pseudobdellovibrionaceae bacterium]
MIKKLSLGVVLFSFILSSASYAQRDTGAALENLFSKTRKSRGQARIAALFNLSRAAYRAKLYQIAAFPLMQIVRESTRTEDRKKALTMLFPIANRLEEKSLIDFATKKVFVEQLDRQSQKLIWMGLAEAAEATSPEKAMSWAQQILNVDSANTEAYYYVGTLMLKLNRPDQALPYFQKAHELLSNGRANPRKRSMALLGIARSYYQMKKWDQAAEYYRKIPKPDPFYRESLTELSWTLFRSGKFRSAISPLQSLETPYYENYFNPEPLLLHGIIHLFSCSYDEGIQKIEGFQNFYMPALVAIQEWSKSARKAEDLIEQIEMTRAALKKLAKTGDLEIKGMALPFFVMRTILTESDIASELRYQDRIRSELEIVDRMARSRKTNFTTYANQILRGRMKATKVRTAYKVQKHLQKKAEEINSISIQFDFLKYEMLNGVRSRLKAKNAKEIPEDDDESKSRDFFVQNGYRLWPLQGETWRDEVGSYQYVGENTCEPK